jgi:hypothetical protein
MPGSGCRFFERSPPVAGRSNPASSHRWWPSSRARTCVTGRIVGKPEAIRAATLVRQSSQLVKHRHYAHRTARSEALGTNIAILRNQTLSKEKLLRLRLVHQRTRKSRADRVDKDHAGKVEPCAGIVRQRRRVRRRVTLIRKRKMLRPDRAQVQIDRRGPPITDPTQALFQKTIS